MRRAGRQGDGWQSVCKMSWPGVEMGAEGDAREQPNGRKMLHFPELLLLLIAVTGALAVVVSHRTNRRRTGCIGRLFLPCLQTTKNPDGPANTHYARPPGCHHPAESGLACMLPGLVARLWPACARVLLSARVVIVRGRRLSLVWRCVSRWYGCRTHQSSVVSLIHRRHRT